MTASSKRGAAARSLNVLAELRSVLRAEVDPNRMLRSVAVLLAGGGDYCIADIIDEHGVLRRLDIVHADPSRREKLRIRASDTRLEAGGRVDSLLARGGGELLGRVSRTARSTTLADVTVLGTEIVSSYMATAISVSGAPFAALTMVSVRKARRFDAGDLAFLEVVGDWTGLGLENALRRQLQPRASVAPPPDAEATTSVTRRA